LTSVIAACAGVPRDGQAGTWITDEMRKAYRATCTIPATRTASKPGSTANWPVACTASRSAGRFYGESMFSPCAATRRKLPLPICAQHLKRRGFGIIDCQMETRHLASLGAKPIPRREFAARLEVNSARVGDPPMRWPADAMSRPFQGQP
jgi:leucyl/phenylalanyl-tRNA--protein transferase